MSDIEVKGTVSGEAQTWKFKRMPIDQAGEWVSKVKARSTIYEALERTTEEMDRQPVSERDIDKYLELSDKKAKILGELTRINSGLSAFVVDPAPEKVETLFQKDPEGVITMLTLYLNTLFPTEAERKN